MDDALVSAVGLVVEGLCAHDLEPADFRVAPGECIVIQGASGAGKTVLLRAIADLDPSGGDVRLGAVSRHAVSGPAWRAKVRYVAAEPGWWAETPRPHFRDVQMAMARAKTLGLDGGALDRPIARLSTGERQRLALIRAIEDAPAVLLLDEPTAALDAKATAAAEALIRGELARGAAILLVTHDEAQAARLATRKLIIEGGKIRMVTVTS